MNLGHGHNLPHVAAPTSNPMGFMPIPSSAGVQRPGVGSSQPPSPPQPQPVQPAAAPAAPPPTVQTADTSRVPGTISVNFSVTLDFSLNEMTN
jgi:protein transport protein SEC31